VTNLLTSLMAAADEGLPIIAIAGNVAADCRGRRSFQEFDPVATFTAAGAVKAAEYIEQPDRVPDAFERLVTIAWTEPRGPVLLDIPYNTLSAEVRSAAPRAYWGSQRQKIKCKSQDVSTAISRLDQAQRPLLVVGRGARNAYQLIRRFIAKSGIPAVHTMGGTGIVSTDDPLYGGLLRHNGSPDAIHLAQNADLIVALGTGLNERATGDRRQFAPHATKIWVDVDARAFTRTIRADVAIETTVSAFMKGILPHTRRRATWRAWNSHQQTPAADSDMTANSRFVSMNEVITAAAPELCKAIVVKDSGAHKYWVTRTAPCRLPSDTVASCHFGAMGFALPASIGASLACPQKQVVAICGDGGFLMSLSDLRTAVNESCGNLKILVLNNCGLASTREYELRLCGSAAISRFATPVDCAGHARCFAMRAESVGDRAALRKISELLRAPGPLLLDCLVDPEESLRPCGSYSDSLSLALTCAGEFIGPGLVAR
jgi:acetolactate synthase-1/2/3 large subunit